MIGFFKERRLQNTMERALEDGFLTTDEIRDIFEAAERAKYSPAEARSLLSAKTAPIAQKLVDRIVRRVMATGRFFA